MAGAENYHERSWPKGCNNLASIDRLPDGYIRNGVNIDCLPDGQVRVRAGRERIALLNNATGAVQYGDNAVIADDGVLRLFNNETNSLSVIGAVPASGIFCGTELNGALFICTQTDRLRIQGDKVLPWGISDVAARVSVGEGILPEGIYRVAVVGVTADGIDSGATPYIVSIAANQGIQVDFTLPTGAVSAKLYATVANGDTLYFQQSLTAGAFSLRNLPRSDTDRLATENLTSPPLGSQMATHNSRLLIVDGCTLHFTEPFMPHHYNRLKGFIAFGSPISVVVSLDGVVFVCADKTYVISGIGTDEQSMRVALDIGAVKGSGVRLSDTRASWLTKYGQAFGDQSGGVSLPTKTSYAPPTAETAQSSLLESGGTSIVVTALHGSIQNSGLGLKDHYDLEII